jgi:hypothetical protein
MENENQRQGRHLHSLIPFEDLKAVPGIGTV